MIHTYFVAQPFGLPLMANVLWYTIPYGPLKAPTAPLWPDGPFTKFYIWGDKIVYITQMMAFFNHGFYDIFDFFPHSKSINKKNH